MTDDKEAERFFTGLRGQFIISQALTIAAKCIGDPELPIEVREPSNAADMLYLRDELFPMFLATEEANTLWRAHLKKEKEKEQSEL